MQRQTVITLCKLCNASGYRVIEKPCHPKDTPEKFLDPCPHCEGSGRLQQTITTTAYKPVFPPLEN